MRVSTTDNARKYLSYIEKVASQWSCEKWTTWSVWMNAFHLQQSREITTILQKLPPPYTISLKHPEISENLFFRLFLDYC